MFMYRESPSAHSTLISELPPGPIWQSLPDGLELLSLNISTVLLTHSGHGWYDQVRPALTQLPSSTPFLQDRLWAPFDEQHSSAFDHTTPLQDLPPLDTGVAILYRVLMHAPSSVHTLRLSEHGASIMLRLRACIPLWLRFASIELTYENTQYYASAAAIPWCRAAGALRGACALVAKSEEREEKKEGDDQQEKDGNAQQLTLRDVQERLVRVQPLLRPFEEWLKDKEIARRIVVEWERLRNAGLL